MVDRCDAEGVAPTFVVEGSPRCPDAACTTYALLDDQDAGAALSVDVDVEAALADGTTVRALYPGLRLDAPVYQAQNVACALALATATLGRPLEREKAVKSLAGCFVPGRFEVVSREPLVVLDACHNPQSAEAFVDAMERFEPDRSRRPTLLLGALADKDHRGIVEAVAPLFEHIVVTQSTSERAYPALDLAREVGEVCGRPVDAVFPRLEERRRLSCRDAVHLLRHHHPHRRTQGDALSKRFPRPLMWCSHADGQPRRRLCGSVCYNR